MEIMRAVTVVAMMATAALLSVPARAMQCGEEAGGALCPGCQCCSRWGWCGSTYEYCGNGCQSQCDGCSSPPPGPSGGGGDVASIISESLFDRMLKHRDDRPCPARGFYTYDAFVTAAAFFPGFGTTGDEATRKRELAAFLAQTAYETKGGSRWARDGPYAWGYCIKENPIARYAPDDYCQPSIQWPCAAGKKYYGRGPIQITYNYNYGAAGEAIGVDLLHDPDLVVTDATVSFETAIWFWMKPRPPTMPSCHDVITGEWRPLADDIEAGRVSGYGVITNIIDGELECGHGQNSKVRDRIGFYKHFCDLLDVSYGDALDCYYQRPFASGKSSVSSLDHADA